MRPRASGSRRRRRAERGSLVRAIAVLLTLLAEAEAGPAFASEPCHDSDAVAILASPRAPAPGGRLRIITVADQPLDAVLTVAGPDGNRLTAASERRGGPPYWWSIETSAGRPGTYRVTLDAAGRVAACQDVRVDAKPVRRPLNAAHTWPVTRQWSRGTENLYSAWIEKLFDAPLEDEPSWPALHAVTRDPDRNLLYGHLGLGEDDGDGLRLEPDCADLPYFLRAYFAWKLGLPFGYFECTRGDGGQPPRCTRWHSSLEPPAATGDDERARMQTFFERSLAWVVQSGAGRTPAESDRTDLYPTRLSRETLRPGTVYADPYGHMLVLAGRIPQTPTSGGLLLAVDAQPDGTVARKRYWRGNFLFAVDPSLGSAGFKHFRPLVRDGEAVRPLMNDEIAEDPTYGDYSLEQGKGGVESFYDRIDDVLSPAPLDPLRTFRETIDALDEQIRARVRSVANGEEYVAANPGTIPMPEGPAIFETTGPWEDFSTPSRDLRLLIAIDVVRRFPSEVRRRPGRFVMPTDRTPDVLTGELDALLRGEAGTRRFQYVRSDGSPWTLTLGDVLDRAVALEVAYDPNDCVEVRWGAPAHSAEMATCARRAPADQLERLERHRSWFHERRRPPR